LATLLTAALSTSLLIPVSAGLVPLVALVPLLGPARRLRLVAGVLAWFLPLTRILSLTRALSLIRVLILLLILICHGSPSAKSAGGSACNHDSHVASA
jgi:hypothetical protein